MRRGDIRLVDFEPARGPEADKKRPAVIVSNDGANATAARLGRGVLTVVPVTSNVRQLYPFQVLLPSADTGLRQDSKAQAEQIRSVAIERIGGQVGRMPPVLMSRLDEALRLHLELLRVRPSPPGQGSRFFEEVFVHYFRRGGSGIDQVMGGRDVLSPTGGG